MKRYGWHGLALAAVSATAAAAPPFEGRIEIATTHGNENIRLHYTLGSDALRIERTGMDLPHPVNILCRESGVLTLVFPHNRSFVQVQPAVPAAKPPGHAGMPPMPDGVGPHVRASSPPFLQSTPDSAVPGRLRPMPPMPMMQGKKLELKVTDEFKEILGFTCRRHLLEQQGEEMEIWATDELPAFQSYIQNEPPPFSPPTIEDQWGVLLREKKLFPLLAILRFQNQSAPNGTKPAPAGPDRMRFEVKSIQRMEIEDKDGALFKPPADFQEVRALR